MYEHSRIEKGQIRLISFIDDSGTICRLDVFDLESAPAYIARSYSWERPSYLCDRDGPTRYPISLNNDPYLVSANLFHALTELCSQIKVKHRLLWVDAICTYSHRSRIKYLRKLRLTASTFVRQLIVYSL